LFRFSPIFEDRPDCCPSDIQSDHEGYFIEAKLGRGKGASLQRYQVNVPPIVGSAAVAYADVMVPTDHELGDSWVGKQVLIGSDENWLAKGNMLSTQIPLLQSYICGGPLKYGHFLVTNISLVTDGKALKFKPNRIVEVNVDDGEVLSYKTLHDAVKSSRSLYISVELLALLSEDTSPSGDEF
jgi:hypothetical protein